MVSPFVCKTIVKIIHLKKVHFPIDLLPLIPFYILIPLMVLRNGTFEWSSQAPVHKVTDLNNIYIHIIGLGFTGFWACYTK